MISSATFGKTKEELLALQVPSVLQDGEKTHKGKKFCHKRKQEAGADVSTEGLRASKSSRADRWKVFLPTSQYKLEVTATSNMKTAT